jgi:hypothetical protein
MVRISRSRLGARAAHDRGKFEQSKGVLKELETGEEGQQTSNACAKVVAGPCTRLT